MAKFIAQDHVYKFKLYRHKVTLLILDRCTHNKGHIIVRVGAYGTEGSGGYRRRNLIHIKMRE